MLQLSNSAVQTLAPGQSIIFDTVLVNKGECGCCHRKNSPAVKLYKRGTTYDVSFNGNIGTTTADGVAELAIQLGGETLPETMMTSETTAAGGLNNVFAHTLVPVCCNSYDRITVTNVGASTINVDANSSLVITH